MPTSWKVTLLALAVSFNCSAFQVQQGRLCSLQGNVTNGVTGEPLRKAYLRLVPTAGGKQFSNTVTDQEGKFTFAAIEPGSYQIEAEHQGFLGREFDEKNGSVPEFRLNAGDKLTDVSVKLTPQSVVSGRVVDEDGDIWTHATVSVAKSVFKQGRRQLQGWETGELDDQGQFRIVLAPGRHYLFARPDETWERNHRSGDSHLQTTWYPSAEDVGGSTPLEIVPGQSLSGLEIRLHRGASPKRIIRGKVSSMDAIPTAQPGNPFSQTGVRAMLTSGLMFEDSSGQLRPDGSFEISVATLGSYDVIVHTGWPSLALGVATVQVTDRDVDNLVIEVKPPRPLRGVIRVEGDDKMPLSGWVVYLDESHSIGFPQPVSRDDGTIEFGSLAQGSYRVLVRKPAAGPFYLRKIRSGGKDFSDGTFSFTGDETPIEIILSPHAASLAVSISPSKSSAQKVVLIPDTSDSALREYRTVVAVQDQNGVFGLRGLAPGAYRLFAFESVPDEAWKDAEFVAAIQDKGAKVELEEGASRSVEVPVLLKSDIAGVLSKLGME